MIRAVLFDMDGTVIDTEKMYCQFWMEAAREAGFNWEMSHSLQIRSMAAEFAEPLLKKTFGNSFDYWKIKARRKELMNKYLTDHLVEKKHGIDQLLEYLGNHYYKTAIVTASDELRAMHYLNEVNLLHKFDEIICAPMVPHGKPMPDVYTYACQMIGEKPEDCIALEDSPNGILSAWRAGCKPVMVPDLTYPDDDIAKLLYGRIDSLDMLIPFLN